jgi:N-formylglutamate amidohydrolase
VLPDLVERILGGLGYSIGRNKPYAGGFITEHYGNPASGLHAVQLELNRAVYMDERRRERGPRFAQVVADFARLADALAEVPLGELGPFQAAAE